MAKLIFCCAVLLISILTFAATAHALEVANKRNTEIIVYAPPQCEPCTCPAIMCIPEGPPCIQRCQCPSAECSKQPCEQPRDCVCKKICKLLPGVVVAPGCTALIAPDEAYPLRYLTVELSGKAYNVRAADLARVTLTVKVVVTKEACAKDEIMAKLYPNPESAMFEILCLVHGER